MLTKNGALVLFAIAVALLAGCATNPGARTAGFPAEVVIQVEDDGSGGYKVTPDPAYVTNPSQDIVWVACSGVPDVTFDNPSIPKPLPEPAKGRARVRIPKGNNGNQPYKVTVTKASGETMTIDPIIIVQY